MPTTRPTNPRAHVAIVSCLANSRKSHFLRQPHEDVGKGTNLRLGRALRGIDQKVRRIVSHYLGKWRHQGTHIKSFLRHAWIADCNAMTFRCGSERQFKCVEYKPLSSIDVRRPDSVKPSTPFRKTRSRMEQRDVRKVSDRSERRSQCGCAHCRERFGKQRYRFYAHPLSGATHDNGVDIRRGEIRLGILEGGAKAGVWRLDHPRVTALLVYSGVHGATDEISASKARDRAAFAQAVTENCLRMVSVTEKPAKRSKKVALNYLLEPLAGSHRTRTIRHRQIT
jgi:hypothetical protein